MFTAQEWYILKLMHYHGRANVLRREKPTAGYLSNIPPWAWSGLRFFFFSFFPFGILWFWMLRIWIRMSCHPVIISVVNKLFLVACRLILKQFRFDCIHSLLFTRNLQHNMQLVLGGTEYHLFMENDKIRKWEWAVIFLQPWASDMHPLG